MVHTPVRLTRRSLLASGAASLFVPRAKANLLLLGAGKSAGGSGPPPYHADAVHFDGSTYMGCNSVTCTDGDWFSYSLWLKIDATINPAFWVAFIVDPVGAFQTYFSGVSPPATVGPEWGNPNGNFAWISSNTSDTPQWYHFLGCGNTNLPAGSKILTQYKNGVKAVDDSNDTHPAFVTVLNGFSFFVGDDTLGDPFKGDLADLRIMPNTQLCDNNGDISTETLRLFIDANGKPVDPAVATAALGTPAILFSGDALTFGNNQGSGGAFTTTGTLTNASSSPSD